MNSQAPDFDGWQYCDCWAFRDISPAPDPGRGYDWHHRACHEAGHVIAALELGASVRHATLVHQRMPSGEVWEGHVYHDTLKGTALQRAVLALAGLAAVAIRFSSWDDDANPIDVQAAAAALDGSGFGMPEARAASLLLLGLPRVQEATARVVEALLRHGTIEGPDCAALWACRR